MIADAVAKSGNVPIIALAVVFIIVGFAFKVSAVPFHTWAPDTYEGAPTPITAFLSVASKAAGFVALLTLLFVGFPAAKDVYQPLFWVLSALTMTVGNVLALRQTNIVRMLAYSSIAQGGFILMPLAVVGDPGARADSLRAVITYLIVYAATNLGAFAVVHRRGPQDPVGRDLQLRRPLQLRARPGRGHDDLPVLAGRHPAARRLDRQVRRVQRRPLGRARRPVPCLAVIGGRELGDRVLLLRRRRPGDVDARRARRRRRARSGCPSRSPLALGLTAVATIVIGVLPQRRPPLRRPRLLVTERPRRPVTPRPRRAHPPPRADPVRAFMDAALYDPTGGFYAAGGGAGGRSGDFLTSPEVGPLFGAVAGPRPRRVVGGPGPGVDPSSWSTPAPDRARSARVGAGGRGRPLACVLGRALRSALARRAGRRPRDEARPTPRLARRSPSPTLPDESASRGVVLANELLDNLPFRLAVHDGGLATRRSSTLDGGASPSSRCWCRCPDVAGPPAARGAAHRGPSARAAGGGAALGAPTRWPASGRGAGRGGRLHVVDRGDGGAGRGGTGCGPTAATQRGGHSLADPGCRTSRPTSRSTSWPARRAQRPRPRPSSCVAHGIDELVEEGRQDLGGARRTRRPRRADRPAAGCGRPRR